MQSIAAPPNPEDDVTTAMFFSFYSVLKFESLSLMLRHVSYDCDIMRFVKLLQENSTIFFYINRWWNRWGDRFCKNRCGIYNRTNLDSETPKRFLKNDPRLERKKVSECQDVMQCYSHWLLPTLQSSKGGEMQPKKMQWDDDSVSWWCIGGAVTDPPRQMSKIGR